MQVDVYKTRREWVFRVEHMGAIITGWSLDEQGARHAAEKSQEFLEGLATRGLELKVEMVAGDDCAGTAVGA